ncbi:MAG: tetratricopeptide repeat protein [Deltaproteobacteria bacterium]|nr:tetratricopeptide repeat protein [Deltaproteobacteria bacterium]
MTQRRHDHDGGFDLLPDLDERPGPARRISSRQAADMVRLAMEAAKAEPVTPPRRSRWKLALALVATLAMAGSAAAAISWHLRERTALPKPSPAWGIEPPTPQAPAVPQPPPPIAPPLPAEVATGVEVPVPKRSAHVSRQPKEEVPEDLLAQANRLRAARRWQEADTVYRQVIAKFPGTTSAHVARVASASLHLEHLDDPRGALRLYEGALRGTPSGALTEEARYGIAESHRALGSPGEELKALRAFIEHHPDSPLRGRAMARLREVERLP